MYTLSIKSCYSYLNIFSILPPIISLYRLTIATLYRYLYIKYIEITYNITYKESLYFAIPDVQVFLLFDIWSKYGIYVDYFAVHAYFHEKFRICEYIVKAYAL